MFSAQNWALKQCSTGALIIKPSLQFGSTPYINKYIMSNWQDEWNDVVATKRHFVNPVLGEWQSSYRRSRRDEVILCHACIGHTFLTYSFILARDHPPQCEHCRCILTVRHILVRCPHLLTIRDDIFGNEDVMESFRFCPQLIIKFVKETGLKKKLICHF